MNDETQASELILAIRQGKGVDEPGGPSENATDCDNAIRLVIERFYNSPTRFITELLANADDANYDTNVTPKVNIVYSKGGYIWFGFNELGFTEANVRAICRIGKSTKKTAGKFIGGKGVGFKSVFTVADHVWVKSGALQFSFDASQPLGMVTPTASAFPRNEFVNAQTMFCIFIEKAAHRDSVKNYVMSLGCDLLLFLRKLRHVNIAIQNADGSIEHAHDLQRRDSTVFNSRRSTITTINTVGVAMCRANYIVVQHTAKAMPFEEKREGVKESDVLIAFPVGNALSPQVGDRDVYNFLPIGAYGFPFVLQADFVLYADTQDVVEDNAWNSALMAAAVELFVESLAVFNGQGDMQNAWPQYLNFGGEAQGTAFEDFLRGLIGALGSRGLLESEAVKAVVPAWMLRHWGGVDGEGEAGPLSWADRMNM